MPLLAKIDVALDKAQTLIFRPCHITLPRAVRAGRNAKTLQMREPTVP
jgi:hypothetical protein